MDDQIDIISHLQRQKTELLYFLQKVIQHESKINIKVNTWSIDIQNRILPFLKSGKMIRGCLLLSITSIIGNDNKSESIAAAAALELLHASLLIHDDIMDQDTVRRGNESIFYQYVLAAKKLEIHDSLLYGQSLGICVGDYLIYLAYKILSSISDTTVIKLISQEIAQVVLAQMQDVSSGYLTAEIAEKDIFNVYIYKTGRYTFSLPLIIATLLSGQKNEHQTLEKIGELLGCIYQLKDDDLNLFGLEKKIGKSVGSDISTNKKTYHRYLLFQKATEEERQQMRLVTQTMHLHDPIVQNTFFLLQKYHIKEMVNDKIKVLSEEVNKLIQTTRISDEFKLVLYELIQYNACRLK